MRRSSLKAAAAIVALSVAIPAFANDGGYFIGPDGSVEYRDSATTAAPAAVSAPSAQPLSEMLASEPVFATMQPIGESSEAYTAPPAPVMTYEAPAQTLSMDVLTDANADMAPAPVYTQSYTAPAPVEVMPAPPVMAEPIAYEPAMIEPMMVEPMPAPVAYTPPPAPVMSQPVIVEAAPQMIEYVAPQPVETYQSADYTTLVDPTPLTAIEALPVSAQSGLSYAERGDGAYGRSMIDRGGESDAGQSTDIFVSKSAIINLPADATEISVSDPNSVRAVLRTARQVVLIGLKVGSTNVIAFDDNNKQILSLDINVRYDLRPLRAAIKRQFPDTLVGVESLLGEVILTGAANGQAEAAEIRNLVRRYLYSAMLGAGVQADPNSIEFVDRLATDTEDQVMLKVRVAEMRRSVIRQFGVDWSLATDAALAGLGAAAGAPGVVDFARSANSFGVNGGQLGGLNANLAGSIGSTDFGALVKAFERHNVMRTLAEPTLTAVTGETASFLAGGEFPFPADADEGGIGFEFKDVGVALEFTPTVVGDGRISLQINTEVSELTNEGSLSIGEITISGISTRRAKTTVELPSGGTMSIAGMMLQRTSASSNGLPGLKNVPVVGQLFSSNDYLNEETELVILVTPYIVRPGQERDFRLPTDGFAPASDIDFYLLGRLHKVYGSGDQDVAAARQALNAPLGFIIE